MVDTLSPKLENIGHSDPSRYDLPEKVPKSERAKG
jgi:hypothetical protein